MINNAPRKGFPFRGALKRCVEKRYYRNEDLRVRRFRIRIRLRADRSVRERGLFQFLDRFEGRFVIGFLCNFGDVFDVADNALFVDYDYAAGQ